MNKIETRPSSKKDYKSVGASYTVSSLGPSMTTAIHMHHDVVYVVVRIPLGHRGSGGGGRWEQKQQD
eukprot:CAMPEP_0194063942 /NCGR_PEP_ID=MMETSP0009_2-20130614/81673_1 /TAXON_ID=210454 /ORGANISM="Grammatophora oceanica, Strain CCMP 410" /LENGTH=66 /DNA_ID=CAMNT_0038716247 /DNA_START=260 /DNA_END=460 /DNA_ORIENTATION=+